MVWWIFDNTASPLCPILAGPLQPPLNLPEFGAPDNNKKTCVSAMSVSVFFWNINFWWVICIIMCKLCTQFINENVIVWLDGHRIIISCHYGEFSRLIIIIYFINNWVNYWTNSYKQTYSINYFYCQWVYLI